MSVLIKDMEMPKSCDSCDLLQDYDGDMYCPLNSYLNFGDIENVPDYVMDSCPLSEVPEQSRIEKELHGKTPEEQYKFLDNLMHKKSVGWNCTALYVIAWLKGEED